MPPKRAVLGSPGILGNKDFPQPTPSLQALAGGPVAGGASSRPDTDVRFSLLQPVRMTQDAADRFGVDGNPAGTVQEASTIEGETVYVIRSPAGPAIKAPVASANSAAARTWSLLVITIQATFPSSPIGAKS